MTVKATLELRDEIDDAMSTWKKLMLFEVSRDLYESRDESRWMLKNRDLFEHSDEETSWHGIALQKLLKEREASVGRRLNY